MSTELHTTEADDDRDNEGQYRVHATLPGWITASGRDTTVGITGALPYWRAKTVSDALTVHTRLEADEDIENR